MANTTVIEPWPCVGDAEGIPCVMEPASEFDAFCERIDRALATQFGPNHQAILSGDGGAQV